MEIIDTLITSIQSLSILAKYFCLLVLYLIGPALFIPMTAIVYATGFILGFTGGIPVLVVGYCMSVVIYSEIAKRCGVRFFPNLLSQLNIKVLLKKTNFLDLIGVVCASLVLPFLVVVGAGGLLKIPSRRLILGLLIGSCPGMLLALEAGSLGGEVIVGGTLERFIWSLFALFGLALLNWLIKFFLLKRY